MTPQALKSYLQKLVEHEMQISTMIWGPPGIGKSSIVSQVASTNGLEFVDVRLSQLAPTDLRGLPVPEGGRSRWYPPEFLPDSGRGILFLDELNMAPPAMQGIAQQLILDRRVGSYVVPDGWFIWAAGNRKEDRASVFEMPAPLANRFLHLEVNVDFDSFKAYSLATGLNEQVLAFLAFRPTLLHKHDPQQVAWPSPRSWTMAGRLHSVGLDIAPVIGLGTAAEFSAYLKVYDSLPDLAAILDGKGDRIRFPQEPSVRYATTIGLTARADDAPRCLNAFTWMADRAPAEWVSLFASDLCRLLRERGQMGEIAPVLTGDPRFTRFLLDQTDLLNH